MTFEWICSGNVVTEDVVSPIDKKNLDTDIPTGIGNI